MFNEKEKIKLRKAFNQEHWFISEIKAVAFFVILLLILSLIAYIFGIEGGRGGNPQENYQGTYYDY
jgi:hypothetical protein